MNDREKIQALERESAEAGDLLMVAVCRRALGEKMDDVLDYAATVTPTPLDLDEISEHLVSVPAAIAECARVIADAAAQDDEVQP